MYHFACTFGFGELKLMEGSAKIISFIARDEGTTPCSIYTSLRTGKKHENDKIMTKVIKDTEEEVYPNV